MNRSLFKLVLTTAFTGGAAALTTHPTPARAMDGGCVGTEGVVCEEDTICTTDVHTGIPTCVTYYATWMN